MISPIIPARKPPTPPRRCTPIIVVSPTTSAEDPPYAPRSPSPGKYAHYRDNGMGFDVGHDIRTVTPLNTHDHTWDEHPQPQLVQASSGITSPFPTAPTSQPLAMAHPSTELLPPRRPISNIEEPPQSGTNLSRPASAHPSLYEQSRNPSPVPQPSIPRQTATGQTSRSSMHHFELGITEDIGNESIGSSDQSRNLHQSYSRPLSHNMSISLTRQAARALSMSFPDPPHHSPIRLPTLMEYPSRISRPPSR